MIVATFSIGYSKMTQSKASIGKEMVTFFLDNHLMYVWTCVVIWSACLYNTYYLMYLNSHQFKNPELEYVSQDELESIVKTYGFSFIVFKITLLITLL